jgi:hypothetical protein
MTQGTDDSWMARLRNPKIYWDMNNIPGIVENGYEDWEGFADTSKVKTLVESIVEKWLTHYDSDEQKAWSVDMLLHYVYELVDQVGEEAVPNEEVLSGMLEAFVYVSSRSKYMMRSDAE